MVHELKRASLATRHPSLKGAGSSIYIYTSRANDSAWAINRASGRCAAVRLGDRACQKVHVPMWVLMEGILYLSG